MTFLLLFLTKWEENLLKENLKGGIVSLCCDAVAVSHFNLSTSLHSNPSVAGFKDYPQPWLDQCLENLLFQQRVCSAVPHPLNCRCRIYVLFMRSTL